MLNHAALLISRISISSKNVCVVSEDEKSYTKAERSEYREADASTVTKIAKCLVRVARPQIAAKDVSSRDSGSIYDGE